ncbi:zinc finger, CCHC-type containing LTR copia-type gag-polypeptide [Tanacetum coccineum]
MRSSTGVVVGLTSLVRCLVELKPLWRCIVSGSVDVDLDASLSALWVVPRVGIVWVVRVVVEQFLDLDIAGVGGFNLPLDMEPLSKPVYHSSMAVCVGPSYGANKSRVYKRVLLLLHSSLSEEAMAEVLGLQTARDVWLALEAAYSHDSVERMHTIKDTLRALTKGRPVDEDDKTHWFLCGLGASFENFSTAIMAKASSFKLYL